MIFFSCLIISLLYFYEIDYYIKDHKISYLAYYLLLFPLIIAWLLISGSQYYVGQDYPSYLEIFNGQHTERYEFGFLIIINICHFFGLYGQALFFIFYSINFYILSIILYKTCRQYSWIYILLFFTVSNIFNNELNILRQCTAIFLGTLCFLYYIDKSYTKAIILFIIALSIHYSSILFLVIPCIKFIKTINIKFFSFIIALSILLSFFLSMDKLTNIVNWLPESYGWYIKSHYEASLTLLAKIPKYIFIPFYLLSLYYYSKFRLSTYKDILFRYGFIFFCLRLSLLNLPIIYRISDNFLLISLYPFYYLILYFHKHNKRLIEIIIVLFLLLLYGIKTILFPSAEYAYSSMIPNQVF